MRAAIPRAAPESVILCWRFFARPAQAATATPGSVEVAAAAELAAVSVALKCAQETP